MRLTISDYLEAYTRGHYAYLKSHIVSKQIWHSEQTWHVEDLIIYTEDYTKAFSIVTDAIHFVEYKKKNKKEEEL